MPYPKGFLVADIQSEVRFSIFIMIAQYGGPCIEKMFQIYKTQSDNLKCLT